MLRASQAEKKVDISERCILSHSNKLNVNFIQFLQAFSSLSRDFFFTVHFFVSFQAVIFFCVCVCMCETENSHFLSPAHKTLCRHCLNGKDVDCAALFHPCIYFSPSESSHKERKPRHLNSSNSFRLGNIETSRSDADETCIFVFMISIFLSGPFLINGLIYVFRKKINCLRLSRRALNYIFNAVRDSHEKVVLLTLFTLLFSTFKSLKNLVPDDKSHFSGVETPIDVQRLLLSSADFNGWGGERSQGGWRRTNRPHLILISGRIAYRLHSCADDHTNVPRLLVPLHRSAFVNLTEISVSSGNVQDATVIKRWYIHAAVFCPLIGPCGPPAADVEHCLISRLLLQTSTGRKFQLLMWVEMVIPGNGWAKRPPPAPALHLCPVDKAAGACGSSLQVVGPQEEGPTSLFFVFFFCCFEQLRIEPLLTMSRLALGCLPGDMSQPVEQEGNLEADPGHAEEGRSCAAFSQSRQFFFMG